jgi:hypothetical protein
MTKKAYFKPEVKSENVTLGVFGSYSKKSGSSHGHGFGLDLKGDGKKRKFFKHF